MTETIPATMKAVVTRGHGGFEMLDYTDVPTPKPQAGEVLLRVSACGLNNTDVWNREARYGTDRDPEARTGVGRAEGKWPRIQGCDVVGKIVAVGAGVDAARIGERILCNFVVYGDPKVNLGFAGSLGAGRDGGYAEYMTLPAVNAYTIDDVKLSDAELATFPCAYITAEHMLSEAGVKAGETVVVTGASGGAGSAIVQLVNARGAHAVAVTSARWRDAVAKLKPAHIVLRDQGGDLYDQVRAALGDTPVDVAADVVGGPAFRDLLALLRPGGRYVTAGAIGGPVVPFDIRTLYLKKLTFYGVSIGYQKHFEAVVAYIRSGKLKPLLAKTYPLSQFRQAQELFVSKDFFGNIVVTPGP